MPICDLQQFSLPSQCRRIKGNAGERPRTADKGTSTRGAVQAPFTSIIKRGNYTKFPNNINITLKN